MKKRLLLIAAVGLGIVFVPYWIGISVKDYFLFGNETRFIFWFWGLYLLLLAIGVGVLLFFVIRFGIPFLIRWLKTGK